MAQALKTSVPTSAVARLLDPEVAERALRPKELPVEPTTRSVQASIRANSKRRIPVIKREFVLTPESEATIVRLVAMYRQSTGARLTASHLLRAVLIAADKRFDDLEREARRLETLSLPANGREYDRQRCAFENRIARAFAAGMEQAVAQGGVHASATRP